MRKLTNTLLALSVAGLGLVLTPGTASAELLDFQIDPSALGGSQGPGACNPGGITPCVADKLTGAYNEVFSVTGAGTFATEAYWDLTAFRKDEATATLLGTDLDNDYSIYALFSAVGTFAPNLSGGFDFTATGGSLTLWADLDVDTSKSLPATAPGAVTLGSAGDDMQLASAPLFAGEGHTTGSSDSGDFELVFSPFALELLGQSFFINPDPFYFTLTVDGVFRTFDPNETSTVLIDGVAEGVFVPEPATLALLGMGLMGSGWAARRRRKA